MNATPGKRGRWMGRTLRWSSYLSALFLLAGMVGMLADSSVPLQVGPPMPWAALAGQLAEFNPYAVMQVGLVVLLVTPVVRLGVGALSSLLKGELGYALVSFAALGLILVSVFLVQRR